MRRMLGALARFSLSSAAFAGQRFASTASAGRGGPGVLLEETLDVMSEMASAQFGEVVEMVHHAGLELAEESLGGVESLLTGDADGRARMVQRARDIAALGDLGDDSARREARAKWDVFWQVRRAREAHMAGRDGRPFDLEPALIRALAHDPEFTFWALEGLGHDYVKVHLESALSPPRRLLAHPLIECLDEGELVALHAGLGLAASEFVLSGLRQRLATRRFDEAVATFERICRAHAIDGGPGEGQVGGHGEVGGHLAVAFEALGLVTFVFFRPLFEDVLNVLQTRPGLRRLFWHGVGRGAYFGGAQLIPGYGSLVRASEKIREVVDDGASRESAMSGLGYAFTMVNIGDARSVTSLLLRWVDSRERHAREEMCRDLRALGTGLAGALAMQRLFGQVERTRDLLAGSAEIMPRRLWRSLIEEPNRRLRREGPGHPLYGPLPWGRSA